MALIRVNPASPLGPRRYLPAAGLQILEDRAVRPVVAVAGMGKPFERLAHGSQLGDLGAKLGDVLQGDALDRQAEVARA